MTNETEGEFVKRMNTELAGDSETKRLAAEGALKVLGTEGLQEAKRVYVGIFKSGIRPDDITPGRQ